MAAGPLTQREAAERTCALVLDTVLARQPPFDPMTARGWLEVLKHGDAEAAGGEA